MRTECSADRMEFAPVAGRSVVAGFSGGTITSDAGALLLGATDRAIGLVRRFAACFTDDRAPDRIEHSLTTLVGQRVLALALGYEDLVDHDQLRHDPVLAAVTGKLSARRADCAPLSAPLTSLRGIGPPGDRAQPDGRQVDPEPARARAGGRADAPPQDWPRRGRDRGAVRRLAPRRLRHAARGDRARPRRDRRPAARQPGRPADSCAVSSTAAAAAIATCRSTCSAATICWPPGCAGRASMPAPARSRRSSASSPRSVLAGLRCGSSCAPIPASRASR